MLKMTATGAKRWLTPTLLLAIAFCFAMITSSHAIGWSFIDAKIRRDFPDVTRISTSELATWLADRNRPAPLLLDVRTGAEYAVSHLRNAQHLAPDAEAIAVTAAKDQPIVTYCSVGYRSGAFAQRLHAAGFTRVANLEGSIFRWANEGRPVFRGAEQVAQVHPYNRVWGLLLQKKYRATLASGGGVSSNN